MGLLAFLCVGLVMGSAVAVTWITVSFTSTGTFVARDGLVLYSNVECTTVLAPVAWGDLHRGDVKGVTAYLKNTGEREVRVSWDYVMTGSSTASWTIMSTPPGYATAKGGAIAFLAPGAVMQIQLTLTCGSGETIGSTLSIATTFSGGDV